MSRPAAALRVPEPVCDVRSAGSLLGFLMAACDERDLKVDDTGTQGGFRVMTDRGWVEVLISTPRHFPATDADADELDRLDAIEANGRTPMSDQHPALDQFLAAKGYVSSTLVLEVTK